jgi:hypothetical protein
VCALVFACVCVLAERRSSIATTTVRNMYRSGRPTTTVSLLPFLSCTNHLDLDPHPDSRAIFRKILTSRPHRFPSRPPPLFPPPLRLSPLLLSHHLVFRGSSRLVCCRPLVFLSS